MKINKYFENQIIILYCWGAFSPVIIAMLIKVGIKNSFVFSLKDLIIYCFAFFSFFLWVKNKRIFNLCLFGILICFVFFMNYLIVNPNYSAPLNNLRQLISPLFLILFFVAIFRRVKNYEEIKRCALFVHYFLFFFGLFDLIFGVWKRFGLYDFFRLKGIPVDSFGLSYMFYEPILNYSLRMTSALLDPISLGHYFATFFCFCWYVPVFSRKQEKYVFFTSLVGLLLTFSKGAMLQVFFMLVLFNKRIILPIRILSILIPLYIVYIIPNKTGLLIHFYGVYRSIVTLSFFGHGVGSVGNYAKMFSNDLSKYYLLGISDTFIGSLVGQVGVFGLILWLTFIINAIYLRNCYIPAKMLISILIISIMSENTLNVTSFILPAMLISWAYSYFLENIPISRLEHTSMYPIEK